MTSPPPPSLGDALAAPRPGLLGTVRRRLRVEAAQASVRALNLVASSFVVGDLPVDVSLTTHGMRLRLVHLAIESIARGTARPRRLILWVDDESIAKGLPPGLLRLRGRGLEVRASEDFGPHTKYYPYVRDVWDGFTPLVTADDDIVYPRTWLQDLWLAHLRHPDVATGYRVHRLKIDGEHIAPYLDWAPSKDREPSLSNFGTGVAGMLYPPAALHALRQAGDDFLRRCRTADDPWIHATLVRNGLLTAQVGPVPQHFPVVRTAQRIGLWQHNVTGKGNDPSIAGLYSPEMIHELRLASLASSGQ